MNKNLACLIEAFMQMYAILAMREASKGNWFNAPYFNVNMAWIHLDAFEKFAFKSPCGPGAARYPVNAPSGGEWLTWKDVWDLRCCIYNKHCMYAVAVLNSWMQHKMVEQLTLLKPTVPGISYKASICCFPYIVLIISYYNSTLAWSVQKNVTFLSPTHAPKTSNFSKQQNVHASEQEQK